ncbi:MAG: zinc ribbon domain-containing protein [Chthoniobacterales bacterium]
MTKLICPDCRHENEPERIYCHNCGGRLDRTSIKKEKAANEEPREATQDRLKKMFDPARGRNKRIALKFAKVLCGALAAAFVIQMLLPPDLPPETRDDSFAPMISMDLLSALGSHEPQRLVYSQDQVNSYLASTIRRKDSPAKEGFFPIGRIFAEFDEGVCRIHTTYRFFGLPLSVSGFYSVKTENGKLQTTCHGGRIGRLPIHPALMSQLDLLMSKTWKTVDRERQQIARLAALEFHPQSVSLITAR